VITIRLAAAALLVAGAGCATTDPRGAVQTLRAAETAFAKSMADRDFDAFASHVADDAVFINGGNPLRGKAAVLAHWKRFFDTPAAPFAWQPELAEVAGDLGYTEGPVSAPEGRVFARFYSTWRRSTSGRWFVVFDNGYPVGQK
jgi:ketosteroid isomerase-like protein